MSEDRHFVATPASICPFFPLMYMAVETAVTPFSVRCKQLDIYVCVCVCVGNCGRKICTFYIESNNMAAPLTECERDEVLEFGKAFLHAF
jgi:hypothetical protein